MHRALFESFYKGNIEVIANEIVRDNSGFVYQENLNGLYEEYLNQRTLLKMLIKNIYEDDGDSNLLDGHKISACITCSIIKVRLIVNNYIEDIGYSSEKAFRMNEQLALLSGLSCLLEFMSENKENLLSDASDESKTKLIFPKTNYEERSTYLDSLVRALYYSNIFSNINPLLLSHIFFLIEQYHRKSVKLENIINTQKK